MAGNEGARRNFKSPGTKNIPTQSKASLCRAYYKLTNDIAGLADLLGHSNLDVTRIYTANTAENYRKQIQRLGLVTEQ